MHALRSCGSCLRRNCQLPQVYRRYLRLEPAHAEEYITYLKLKTRWGEAAQKLAEVVNDETFRCAGCAGHALCVCRIEMWCVKEAWGATGMDGC